MQSGITASSELSRAFAHLLSTPSERGLLVSISPAPESLVPSHTLPSSSTFSADLAQLDTLLSDKEARYVLLKQDAGQGVVAVTYVPDAAPVRSKMLFASTSLTLVRELGTEHISQTLFATTKAELTAQGWAKHEAHGSLAAPLTQEEQDLAGIKEAEAQASMGTSTRRGHMHGGVALPLDDEATAALQALREGGKGLVSLGIDVPNEVIVLASTADRAQVSPAKLSGLISATEPRYTIYAHEGREGRVNLFVYTCPNGASIKARMLYATNRNGMIHATLPGVGVSVDKRLEATSPDEIGEAEVLAEVEPVQEESASAAGGGTRGGFARPKRPGKR